MEHFFKEQRKYQQHILQVNEGQGLADGTFMTAAKRALKESGHNINSIIQINDVWPAADAAEKAKKVKDQTTFDRFIAYYTAETKKLYLNSDH